MIRKTIQKHYNQQKQRDENLEIDSEDTETGPYHHTIRDQDMILQTEEIIQENDQSQVVIQDLEIIKVQKKLEQTLKESIMDLKPETNQGVEAKERIDEGSIVINE
ncbi:MAG: hypothetical protein EZS28_036625 [Streblomastix strix]|uniref:Uncharacterized protein n=1 Tax=Streblomastix strix TaxID=222440 RepID=A0A5J4UD56_9EUKA|nr:MAG: hypothetical protein EZS28_036625 [Streblomastix strix]